MEEKLNFSFKKTQEILKKISEIDQFKGKWLAIRNEENQYLKELKRIATIMSIGSSTRIEGAKLSDEEIEKLLNNMQINNLESRDEQEVAGYYNVLDTIIENNRDIMLSESHIFQLHNLLLKFSTKDSRHRGKYKNLSNKVVAKYPDGQEQVIFDTTAPYLVKIEMSELLKWTNDAFNEGIIHPLLIISLFIYEFLSIHPFQDGNGRLSRLITTLLLLKSEYHFIQFISFEHLIEKRKKEYYRVLMECQKKRVKGKMEKIEKWVVFFIDCISNLIVQFEKKYTSYKSVGGYLNERQKSILSIIKKKQPVRLADVFGLLKDVSINTIRKDLKYLVIEGFLRKTGKNKGTSYLIMNN